MLPRLEMGFVHCLFRTIAPLKSLDDAYMPPLKFCLARHEPCSTQVSFLTGWIIGPYTLTESNETVLCLSCDKGSDPAFDGIVHPVYGSDDHSSGGNLLQVCDSGFDLGQHGALSEFLRGDHFFRL